MRHLLVLVISFSAACYHYSFEQRRARPDEVLVTHVERAPTYLNGLLGTGEVDTSRYCADPVRTELKVKATDVLISIATLLIYTPHTLYVTCGVPTGTDLARRRAP
jgi:hypothetical protein